MVIAGKIIATLNLSTQDGPIIIFPIEQMSRFQAQAYGESMGSIRLDEPVLRLGTEGLRWICAFSEEMGTANSPRGLERKKL